MQADEFKNVFYSGGVVNVPDSTKYKYIHLSVSNSEEVRICNIGVFTCPCSNYMGSRDTSVDASYTFDFTATSEAKIVQSISIANPSIKGSCPNHSCT